MSQPKFEPGSVEAEVADCLARYSLQSRAMCVAFSGGMDSTVLLHALTHSPVKNLRAVHVNHQLHTEADAWAGHCEQTCNALGAPLTVISVDVDTTGGTGLEAAAREARYGALEAELDPEEILITAHHRADQLETFLLQLFRGAGVQGLAAMAAHGRIGRLELIRPILNVSAEAVRRYADGAGIDWIDDPSNEDTDLDRNFVRHNIVPCILERWPAADRAVSRSARLAGEAAEILDATAAQDLQAGLHGNRLRLDALRSLPGPRQRNGLRWMLRMLGLAVPSEKQLADCLAVMLESRPDSNPEAVWPGVRIRRFRDCLWCYSEEQDPAGCSVPADGYPWDPEQPLDMGPVRGTLVMAAGTGEGIAPEFISGTLQVRFRQGGEKLRTRDNGRTRQLKNLLQESDIPPWMRCHIPLIYSGETLLAAGDLWVNADCAARAGQAGKTIHWSDYSPIR
ncbi:MAG: tRNA lysidine(34) synthetase TilS [Gammaproteobacteria bacterium]|nr:tRNA lysidine(34) synthetase TilS [Gammaproteobacteria bacterium]